MGVSSLEVDLILFSNCLLYLFNLCPLFPKAHVSTAYGLPIFASDLFFYTDRNSMYWWELVVLLRKYFIITASTFVVSDTNQLQMTFGIVLVALLLHITNHPFERDTQAGATLQLYEMMSLLVLSVVIWCGQYFTNSPGMCETTHEGTCTFMMISIFLINFVYMLLLFIKCGSHWWKRKRVAKKLGRLKKKFSSTFKKSGFESSRGGEKKSQGANHTSLGAGGSCNIEMVVSTGGPDVTVDTDIVNPMSKRQKSVHRAMERSARKARSHRRAQTEGSLAIGLSGPNVRRQTTQMLRRQPPGLACAKINENMGTAQGIAHRSSDVGSAVGEQMKIRQEEDVPLYPQTLVRETSSLARLVALYDYNAADDDEIDLQEGDIIENVDDFGGGWLKGTNTRTGITGVFPAAYGDR